MNEILKAPFPYFGGKSRVADIVWAALGDVANYVEPFAGSLAVLLARPHRPKIETVNDMDGLLANFWRAVANAPDEVAFHADWPVNEADLEARHLWLVRRKEEIRTGLGDPEWYDAKAAGWWVWGICSWIGGGWCSGEGPWSYDDGQWANREGRVSEEGISRRRPHLGDAGRGINRKRPHLGDVMTTLADRLRNVRVCCGDWSRVCGPSVTFKHGLTGVFLDPPYMNEGRAEVYNHDDGSVAKDVTEWALENGEHRDMRIVVAGYEGEHGALTAAGWRVEHWKAHGGMGAGRGGRGDVNKHRERLWFSPNCIPPEQGRLL